MSETQEWGAQGQDQPGEKYNHPRRRWWPGCCGLAVRMWASHMLRGHLTPPPIIWPGALERCADEWAIAWPQSPGGQNLGQGAWEANNKNNGDE